MEGGGEAAGGTHQEWDSFMYRVDQVGRLIQGLTSDDHEENMIALRKSDEFLGKDVEVDENKIHVKQCRTLINTSAAEEPERDSRAMSQETFMKSVEIDARKRSEERRLNKEEADRWIKAGNGAFRQQDFNKALANYNRAIELVRDSCLLYTNRALTCLRLGLYRRALNDADLALRLSPASLKAALYKGQALHALGDSPGSARTVQETCERHPDQKDFILGRLIQGLTSDDHEENMIALRKSDEFLGKDVEVDENKIHVKQCRTLINTSAAEEPERDSRAMSQETFMKSVEIDARKRSEERRLNKEEADRWIKAGNGAFRQQDFNKALANYNRAIELVRDSCLLYTNRALTCLRLGLYRRALNDADLALRLSPASLKAALYKGQALHALGDSPGSARTVQETCERHPDQKDFILDIEASWKATSKPQESAISGDSRS